MSEAYGMIQIKSNQAIHPNVLPQNLQYLILADDYNQKIKAGILLLSLRDLKFGYDYNQPIDPSVLPNGLRSLEFGNDSAYQTRYSWDGGAESQSACTYNQYTCCDILPPSLRSLKLGDAFNQIIDPGVLPPNLQ